jgi:hypothetical protein
MSTAHHSPSSIFLPNVNTHDLDAKILSYLSSKDITKSLFQLNKLIRHVLLYESNEWLWYPMYNELYVEYYYEPWNQSYEFPYLKGIRYGTLTEEESLQQQKDRENSYEQNYRRKSLFNESKWKALEQKIQHSRDIGNNRTRTNNLIDNEQITFFHCILKPQLQLDKYFSNSLHARSIGITSRGESVDMKDLTGLFAFRQKPSIEQLNIESYGDESVIDYFIENNQNKNIQKLRALHIGEISYRITEISWIYHGDRLGSLIQSLPINHFVSCGGIGSLQNAISTHLVSLVIVTGGIGDAILESLFNETHLPNLAHLELWLGEIRRSSFSRNAMYKCMRKTLLSEEESGLFPRLRYLGLRNSQHINGLAKLIPYAAITQRITTLDLSHGSLHEHGVYRLILAFEEVLANNSNAFDQLSQLILRDNYLVKSIQQQIEEYYEDTFEGLTYGERLFDDDDDEETKAISEILTDDVWTLSEFCEQRESKSMYQILYDTLGKGFALDASESYSNTSVYERYTSIGE